MILFCLIDLLINVNLMFRDVKVHWSAKTSTCKNPSLEVELKAQMRAEPDKPEVVMRLLRLLQCEGPPRGRIQEAYKLCLSRRRDWRGSADWQSAILELCENYQVRNCNNHAGGSEPCYVLRISCGREFPLRVSVQFVIFW